jgi:hypothetical protein
LQTLRYKEVLLLTSKTLAYRCHLFALPKYYLEKKMLNDEIVDEVRAIRDTHAAKFDDDLRAIYNDLKKSEAEHIAADHPFIPAPERPLPDTALQRSRFAHR